MCMVCVYTYMDVDGMVSLSACESENIIKDYRRSQDHTGKSDKNMYTYTHTYTFLNFFFKIYTHCNSLNNIERYKAKNKSIPISLYPPNVATTKTKCKIKIMQ